VAAGPDLHREVYPRTPKIFGAEIFGPEDFPCQRFSVEEWRFSATSSGDSSGDLQAAEKLNVSFTA
jgi:hypothetical protein